MTTAETWFDAGVAAGMILGRLSSYRDPMIGTNTVIVPLKEHLGVIRRVADGREPLTSDCKVFWRHVVGIDRRQAIDMAQKLLADVRAEYLFSEFPQRFITGVPEATDD